MLTLLNRILELEGNNGKGLHPFQILFARMGITVILASAYMYWKKTPHFPFGAREIRPLLVARGLGGFFGVFGMYYSLLYLPLADATVITFLAPGIACWACSYILREPFTRMEQIAAYVSLFGVVLIARPTSFFTIGHGDIEPSPLASGDGDVSSAVNGTSPTVPSSAYDFSNVTAEQRAKGVAVAMLGVLGAASAYTTLRWIGKRAHPLISVNYFATWCTIVSIVMMFALPGVGFLLPANPKEWGYLFFLGTCGFIMQFLLASGFQYEKGSRATNMVYTQMLFALGFDKLIFGTVPGWTSIIGSSLILGSAIYVAVQKDVAASSGPAPATSYILVNPGDEERGQLEANELGDLVDTDSDDSEHEHGITSAARIEA
jgi:drug/metabolite transporter (DMT)-like permease